MKKRVKKKIAASPLASERLLVCMGCPELGDFHRCKQCGRFMLVKTKLPNAICPLGKW